jgi:hypothetical protein
MGGSTRNLHPRQHSSVIGARKPPLHDKAVILEELLLSSSSSTQQKQNKTEIQNLHKRL